MAEREKKTAAVKSAESVINGVLMAENIHQINLAKEKKNLDKEQSGAETEKVLEDLSHDQENERTPLKEDETNFYLFEKIKWTLNGKSQLKVASFP